VSALATNIYEGTGDAAPDAVLAPRSVSENYGFFLNLHL
jgi:hypothetical protein